MPGHKPEQGAENPDAYKPVLSTGLHVPVIPERRANHHLIQACVWRKNGAVYVDSGAGQDSVSGPRAAFFFVSDDGRYGAFGLLTNTAVSSGNAIEPRILSHFVNQLAASLPHRQAPFFVALAYYSELVVAEYIIQVESGYFGQSQTAAVSQFHHGPVANGQFRAIFNFEQLLNFVDVQLFWQRAPLLWCLYRFGGILF